MRKSLPGLLLNKRFFIAFLFAGAQGLCIYSNVTAQKAVGLPAITNNFVYFSPKKVYQNIDRLYKVNKGVRVSNADFGLIPLGTDTSLYEIYGERTATTRTLVSADGLMHIIQAYSPINYLDGSGNYVAIDPRLSPSSDGWAALQQAHPTFLHKDGSTELSVSDKDKLKFNFNNTISGKLLNLQKVNTRGQHFNIHFLIIGPIGFFLMNCFSPYIKQENGHHFPGMNG